MAATSVGRPAPLAPDDRQTHLLIGLGLLAGALLLLPAAVVAGLLLLLWRCGGKDSRPVLGTAYAVAAGGLLWLATGVQPLMAQGPTLSGLFDAYLAVQWLYAQQLVAIVRGSDSGLGPLLLRYAGDVRWPALPAGLVLAGGWEAWRRAGRVKPKSATPAPVERHPAPPTFSKRVLALAKTGAPPVVTQGLPWARRPVEALPLGYGPEGETVALTGAQMTHHALVCGLTGAGKTTLMAALIRAARALGWSVVCLDLKGSPSLRRLFYELDGGTVWTPRGPRSLDLLRGYPDEVAAKIVTVAGTVTGQQFNQIAQGRLTELVKELDAAGEPRTFTGLQALLQRETKTDKPQQALVDLEARLRTVTSSSAEPWLRPGPDALHLERAVRAGEAVLLSIPVPRLKLVGEKLGAWSLAEANRVASRLTATDWGRKTGKRCLLLIDEFAGLKEQGAHVAQPLAMVREGGVSIWLFTQTLSGLKRLGEVAYSEILGNVNVQLVLRQSEPDDQQALSELLGDYTTQEFSRSLDGETGEGKGDFRARTVTRPYVTPGQIAALPIGQGYVRIAGSKPLAVVFPNTAGGTGEEPDVEPEDDDGTPDVGATRVRHRPNAQANEAAAPAESGESGEEPIREPAPRHGVPDVWARAFKEGA